MKRFIYFWKYTKDVWLMLKLLIWFLINRIWILFHVDKLKTIATNIVCKKPYILWTDFGNYLAISLQHYCSIIDDYEIELQREILRIIERDVKNNRERYLINIWANIWRYSVWLAYTYWFNVLAFEPNPQTFKNLKINTVLSDVDEKTDLYNIWLWDVNWNLEFTIWEILCDWKARIVTGKSLWVKNIIKVPVKKFDDLWIDSDKIDKTRLIIMDVEWFELNVLKWMEKALKNFHDINIIMEIWDDQENKEKVLNLMKWLGYDSKQLDKDDRLFTK